MKPLTMTPNLRNAGRCLRAASQALNDLYAWLESGNETRDYDNPRLREAWKEHGFGPLHDGYLLASVADGACIATLLAAIMDIDTPPVDLPSPDECHENPEMLAIGADCLELAADLIDVELDTHDDPAARTVLAGIAAAARNATGYTSECCCGRMRDADRKARHAILIGVDPPADEPLTLAITGD